MMFMQCHEHIQLMATVFAGLVEVYHLATESGFHLGKLSKGGTKV